MPIRPENRGRYPANWLTEIRPRILERACGVKWPEGFKDAPQCECVGECGRGHGPRRCSAVDGEPHPETGSRVVLTIAHLDHTPEHCEEENLRAMCQACHLSYDAEHHAIERSRNEIRELELAGQARLFDD